MKLGFLFMGACVGQADATGARLYETMDECAAKSKKGPLLIIADDQCINKNHIVCSADKQSISILEYTFSDCTGSAWENLTFPVSQKCITVGNEVLDVDCNINVPTDGLDTKAMWKSGEDCSEDYPDGLIQTNTCVKQDDSSSITRCAKDSKLWTIEIFTESDDCSTGELLVAAGYEGECTTFGDTDITVECNPSSSTSLSMNLAGVLASALSLILAQ
jgi:hypothetical protein